MKKIIFIFAFSLTYIITFAQTLEPTETKALVNVKTFNASGKPHAQEVLYFDNVLTQERDSLICDTEGKGSLLLLKNSSYVIKYMYLNKLTEYSKITIPNEEGLMSIDFSIGFEDSKDSDKASFNPLYFKANSSIIDLEYIPMLDDIIAAIKFNKNLSIQIAGYSCKEEEQNIIISQQRADAVKKYLTQKGADINRIKTIGNGYKKLEGEINLESECYLSRKVEFAILTQ